MQGHIIAYGCGLGYFAYSAQGGGLTYWGGPWSADATSLASFCEENVGRQLTGEELLLEMLAAMQKHHRKGQPVGMVGQPPGRGGMH